MTDQIAKGKTSMEDDLPPELKAPLDELIAGLSEEKRDALMQFLEVYSDFIARPYEDLCTRMSDAWRRSDAELLDTIREAKEAIAA